MRRWVFDCDAAIACNVVTVGDADDVRSESPDEFKVVGDDDDDELSSTGCQTTPFDV